MEEFKEANSNKGYLLALTAGIGWGLVNIFVKILADLNFDCMFISAIRPTIAVVFLIIISIIKDRSIFKTDLKGIFIFMVYGIFALDGMFLGTSYAVKYTNIATAAVLLFTNPIFSTIIAYFLFKEKITIKKIIALVLALIGCVLVVKAYDIEALKLNLTGIMWGIGSGVAVALQNIIGKISLKNNYNRKTHLIYSFLFATIFLWCFVTPAAMKVQFNLQSIIILALLGTIGTLIPSLSIMKALEYIEASKASIISSVELVIATILGYIIFKESLDVFQIIGMLLIVSSILLIQSQGNVSNKRGKTKIAV
ncbi:DMT family transporter [Clostridium aestuarii]|uniref:DMT family transporter n=1 Tax=Clostridium aestuarii TaxID=338193 RepID=A0ABT4D3B9_9CLOT|nr:DMT family transporter [Clostridium aestuarii]MCY6485736.1 DMT family transporter [Clostridium aestuarii]